MQTFESATSFLEELSSTQTPVCLLLDVRMPGMTGIDLVEHMAENDIDIPTILITAHDEEYDSYPDSSNVLACLHKPADEKIILKLIEESLSNQIR